MKNVMGSKAQSYSPDQSRMHQFLFHGLCLGVLFLCASVQVTTAQERPTFLEVAVDRFEARVERSITEADKNLTFDGLQLVRVPKAGSSEASMIARRLAGCEPRGPCCNFPGNPAGSCPIKNLYCKPVVGCTGHRVDRRVLQDPSVFSMSNLRDVVDRMVSGFFYAAPHSPRCARKISPDYGKCFEGMIGDNHFRNVISRMFTGNYAYNPRSRVCWDLDSERCTHDLRSVVHGACNVNYITMCEVWSTSVLLLFETLPWIGPSEDYFPLAKAADAEESLEVEGRKNVGKKHEEGMKYITPELRAKAREANSVDQAIYDFVSAKFCHRLREVDLLTHPIVDAELATFSPIYERCSNSSWVESTLETFTPFMPEDCRLFQPLARPADAS